MTSTATTWVLLIFAFIAANLPWLNNKLFFFRTPASGAKWAGWRWLEWLLLYFVTGALALGLEQKLNGEIYAQGWEFYAVTLCLFLVFALPGFIYQYDLRLLLQRR
jgi:hypothetical protein